MVFSMDNLPAPMKRQKETSQSPDGPRILTSEPKTKSRTTRQLVFADTFVHPTNTNYRSEHKNGKTHKIANDLRAPTRLYIRRPQIIKYEHANCKARTPTGSYVRRHNHMQAQKWQSSKDCERLVRADTFARSEPTNYHIRKTDLRTTCACRNVCTLGDRELPNAGTRVAKLKQDCLLPTGLVGF